VRAVIHVAINLRFLLSPEQPVQNLHPPPPRSPSLVFEHWLFLLLSYAHMPVLPKNQGISPAWSLGMGSHRLANDQPSFGQPLDLLMGVAIGNFFGLIGVPAELQFAEVQDTGGEPLLKPEHTCVCVCGIKRKEFYFIC
ncbi:Hypothetical predicted protein, partial [Marmota monax]